MARQGVSSTPSSRQSIVIFHKTPTIYREIIMKLRKSTFAHLFVLGNAAALWAPAALADDCPTPTADQCSDKSYVESACGRAQLSTPSSACNQVYAASYDTATRALPASALHDTMPPGRPGDVVAAVSPEYTFEAHRAHGIDTQLLGTMQRTQLLGSLKNGQTAASDLQTQAELGQLAAKRQAWQANGNRVDSCAEYVYERYFDWNLYRDAADAVGANDRRAVEIAYDLGGPSIANRTLMSKSGARTLPTIKFPSRGAIGKLIGSGGTTLDVVDDKTAKNGFLSAYGLLSKGDFFGNDAALKEAMRAGSSYWKVSWDWHKSMSEALTKDHVDDELRYWDEKQRTFVAAVGQRALLVDEIAAKGPTETRDDGTIRDRQSELQAMNASLREMLAEAQAAGCLSLDATSVCDWSPHMFRDQIEAFTTAEESAAYQRCMDMTGDDFSQAKTATQAFAGFATKDDYTTSAEDLEAYFGVIKSFLAATPLPLDPETKQPMLGNRKSDSGDLGKGDFSLHWSYDTGWGVTNLGADKDTCEAEVGVDAVFDARGTAFGFPVDLIHASAKFETRKKDDSGTKVLKGDADLRILGSEIWNPDGFEGPASFNLVKTPHSGGEWKDDTTFFVFGVPVSISAGVGFNMGFDVNAGGSIGGSCADKGKGREVTLVNVTSKIKPWTQVDAFAAAGIGASFASAGVRCDLVVLHGEMPLSATAKLLMSSSGNVVAKVQANAHQTFRMLDGKVSVYLDAPGDWFDADKTVFEWQGPKIDEDLFRWSRDIPLAAVKQRLGSSS
jgi:hypothetical protein